METKFNDYPINITHYDEHSIKKYRQYNKVCNALRQDGLMLIDSEVMAVTSGDYDSVFYRAPDYLNPVFRSDFSPKKTYKLNDVRRRQKLFVVKELEYLTQLFCPNKGRKQREDYVVFLTYFLSHFKIQKNSTTFRIFCPHYDESNSRYVTVWMNNYTTYTIKED